MPEAEPMLFQFLCDAMPLGLCLVDMEGKIVFWNAASEAITGYLRQEVLGRLYRGDLLLSAGQRTGDVIPPGLQCPVIGVLRDGRPVAAEMFLRHKDGHRAPVHVEAFALRDAMGEMRGVVQILDHQRGKLEVALWPGRAESPSQTAELPTAEASRERLELELGWSASSPPALLLIELQELPAIRQHGGTALVHRALRVLARTVAELLPPEAFLGRWSEERLLVLIPAYNRREMEALEEKLSGVGSACAVKWWGDRVKIQSHVAARFAQPEQPAEAQILALELELNSAAEQKE